MAGSGVLLDGVEVARGDTVYDLAYGAGHIAMIDHDGFGVRFMEGAEGRVIHYVGGKTAQFTKRTLYWGEPVIAHYPPDSKAASIYRTTATALNEALYKAMLPD